MEFDSFSLEAMKEILGKNKKRYRRLEAMKKAGYLVAAAGVALGGAWIYGTTNAVDESVFQATKDTLLAGGIFAGAGIATGVLASIKGRRVNKCMKQLEKTLTGYKIKRKWSFKPYLERKVKAVTPMSQNQKTIAEIDLMKNIKKYLDKGVLSAEQYNSLCNVYPGLKRLADSYMPKGNPEPDQPKPVEEEGNTEMVDSLTAFENAMADAVVDDVNGASLGDVEMVLSLVSLIEKDKELFCSKYKTMEGAVAGSMMLLDNAQMLNKDWYPMEYCVALEDKEGNKLKDDKLVFENATQLADYYEIMKQRIETKTEEKAMVNEEEVAQTL